MRTIENLNYDWKYCPTFEDNYMLEKCDERYFEKVSIPHTNIEIPFNNFDEKVTQFVSAYRREIKINKADLEKCIILEFDGVSSYAEVYVNGKLAFAHKGAYTAFGEDISRFLKEGKNTIAVKCDSTEREDIPPFGHVVDYLTYGGIYREVRLVKTEKQYIKNVQILAKNPLEENKAFEVWATLSNEQKDDLEVSVDVFYKGGFVTRATAFSTTDKVLVKGEIEKGLLWDIDNPRLYDFVVTLVKNASEIDQTNERFGFRLCEFKYAGFYLNGKKLKLRGLNRHQAYPYVGYAMPKSMQVEDARFLKKTLKVNLVRTSHYPQSQHFLNACDELGLLVFTEAPGWQHIGGEEFKETFKNNVAEMVIQNRNHPSIILWGVRVNESPDCDELYIETNRIAKSLDSTRQTGGVRNFAKSNLYEDVYTYNDFIHDGKRMGLEPPKRIARAKVPYLVTENNGHMYPTKRYDNEERRAEHALRHARVLNEAYKREDISGELGWCMSDYNTHKDFGSGDRICYHGVSDMFRIPKLAAAAFISQGDDEPYLFPISDMQQGDYDANLMGKTYIFTNLDQVKMYKNGVFVDIYTKADSELKNLPHPVIFVPDLIGTLIEQDGKYTKAESKKIRRVLAYIAQNSFEDLPLRIALPLGMVMLKHKIKFREAYDEFGKFLTTWGDEDCEYKFEGYKDGKLIKTVYRSNVKQKHLEYAPTSTVLRHGDTYDVALVRITAESERGNILPYAFDALQLETTGAIEIIGDSLLSLQGGAIGVYVKSVKTGKGTLRITSMLEVKEIDFVVV